MVPTFRPDFLIDPSRTSSGVPLERLEAVSGVGPRNYGGYIRRWSRGEEVEASRGDSD